MASKRAAFLIIIVLIIEATAAPPIGDKRNLLPYSNALLLLAKWHNELTPTRVDSTTMSMPTTTPLSLSRILWRMKIDSLAQGAGTQDVSTGSSVVVPVFRFSGSRFG